MTLAASPALDLDTHYPLTEAQIRQFREDGFIKLKDVLSPQVIEHYGKAVTDFVLTHNPMKDEPLEQRDTYGKAFIQGSWGAAIVDALKPEKGDIVVEGKRGLDTFASTNLDFILRSKGIKTVILGGFLTNCCVESTMRTAYEHGFDVITLTDCVAATSREEHQNAIKYDFPMFSRPMPSSELIGQLGA